ncbi:MAG: ABC transporter ATP-binding protein [Candidatus Kerfeldbacteria bacterium]|nr:ABC transporter ATP-binding protein [Candidatus Kerfeldbacteria bacterium]
MQITIQHLTKEYRMGKETVRALKGVTLDIEKGEMIALIGRSGSGKSTLLQLIGGLDTPTSGSVAVNGKELGKMKDRERSTYRNNTIGFVFQFFYLQPYLTISQNVQIPLIFQGVEKNTREQSAKEALETVGLGDMLQRLPNQLSGGQMQRVAIARALVHKPEIVLADEPTGNLDEKTGDEILELIKKLNKEFNTTFIIVTHDSHVASQADRIIQLADGQIVTTNA